MKTHSGGLIKGDTMKKITKERLHEIDQMKDHLVYCGDATSDLVIEIIDDLLSEIDRLELELAKWEISSRWGG